MSTKNGDESAFPCVIVRSDDHGQYKADRPGMTKREVMAIAMAQTMCSGPGARMVADTDTRYDETNWKEIVALNACEFADALLAELDK